MLPDRRRKFVAIEDGKSSWQGPLTEAHLRRGAAVLNLLGEPHPFRSNFSLSNGPDDRSASTSHLLASHLNLAATSTGMTTMMHHMRVFRNLSGREFAGSSSPGAIRATAANRLRIIP
jgi:hypothetical protein